MRVETVKVDATNPVFKLMVDAVSVEAVKEDPISVEN
jgi:hypothetical protein